jgi:hypothetical protein
LNHHLVEYHFRSTTVLFPNFSPAGVIFCGYTGASTVVLRVAMSNDNTTFTSSS